MSENSKYRELFVQEAVEHVDILNQYLLKYEEDPNSKELIDHLFRSAHSLKGMAATMGYEQIREICKSIEEIFNRFRQHEEKITPESANVIYHGIDLLKQLVLDDKKAINLEELLNYFNDPRTFPVNTSQQNPTVKSKSPTMRVKMDDLDTMMNIVGELMINKMRLEQNIHSDMNAETRDIVSSMGRLITALQHEMMIVRLVPVEQIFDRFSKMIRDVSSILGKEIKLEMDGGGIEVDRTVLDAITDPLLHILRNAVDHGIEASAKRMELGKPEFGTINLSVMRTGDKVEIHVSDDGRGIDIESIKKKAFEKNIATSHQLINMSDEEVIGLLGTPGLSTANEVTDISGRGVGMDVVMTQIKNFGGQVKILTEKGHGTKIILSMPLSLSIMGGLIVNIGEQKFILPLASILTTITVEQNEIQNVHGKEMVRLGDEIIPMLRTSNILGIKSMSNSRENEQITIVVVQKDGKHYGLVVDSLEREQEIVVKKLDNTYDKTETFSDATILPDGRVALIIDPGMII